MQETDDAARREVARAVKAKAGRLRKAAPRSVLVLLGAAAFAPIVAAALATGSVPMAGVAVAGNLGAGPASQQVVDWARRQLRKDEPPPEIDELRREFEAEFDRLLSQQDVASDHLHADLTALLQHIGAEQAAVAAAVDDSDLAVHLTECFADLRTQGETVQSRLDQISIEQHRQSRAQSDLMTLMEEVLGRVSDPGRQTNRPDHAVSTGSVAWVPAPATDPVAHNHAGPVGWQKGAEVTIGGAKYMLHDHGLLEEPSPDGSHLLRRARAVRIPPTNRPGGRYVWLRQVVQRHQSSSADRAVGGLEAEHAFARRLRRVPGLPHVLAPVSEAGTTTAIVTWPLSKVWQGPCETLADVLGPPGQALSDPLRKSRLLSGLAGLATTIDQVHRRAGTSHRSLSPGGVLRLDDGRLVLRDWGLAGLTPRPGETGDEVRVDGLCVAPEQRHGGDGRPGPATDSYQLAALAYRLLTGQVPVAGRTLPVQALVQDMPDAAAQAIDAALAVNSAERPAIGSLAAALRQRSDATPNTSGSQ